MKTKILILFLFSIFYIGNTQPEFSVSTQDSINMINDRAIKLVDTSYVNTNFNYDYEGSFSWFCWINTTSDYPYGYIMSEYRVDSDPNVRLQMRSSGNLWLMFNLGGSETIRIETTSGISVNDGKDHFIGFVMDRNSWFCTLWVDGNPVSSADISGHTSPLNPTTPFWIGTKNSDQLYTFKGIIDDVQCYNGNLTGDQIRELFGNGNMIESGNPFYIKPTNLIGWWRFNEQVGDQTWEEISKYNSSIIGKLIGNVQWIRR